MTLLLLASAIALSGIAAFYSIMGLMAIFSGAAMSIAVMGSVLEVSKIVVTSWLYRNWEVTPRLLKSYFVSAIVVLMFLTSMGIFGFLSKAHMEQGVSSGDVSAKVALIQEQINTHKENIDASRKALAQLDSQVDAALSRTTDANGASSSSNLRRAQSKERARLIADIGEAQKEVARLAKEKAPAAAELRKVDAEVGPIRYIAALIYGDNPDASLLEKAVRIMILMIVFVFDPLAVLMFIAVNQSLAQAIPKPKSIKHELALSDETMLIDYMQVAPRDLVMQLMDEVDGIDEITMTESEPLPLDESTLPIENLTFKSGSMHYAIGTVSAAIAEDLVSMELHR